MHFFRYSTQFPFQLAYGCSVSPQGLADTTMANGKCSIMVPNVHRKRTKTSRHLFIICKYICQYNFGAYVNSYIAAQLMGAYWKGVRNQG